MNDRLITILAVGSRGDINPAVALGIGLKQAGYQVRVATHTNFADWVQQWNLEFAPLAGDYHQLLNSEIGYSLLEGKDVDSDLSNLFSQQMRDSFAACQGSSAIVFFPLSIWGYHIVEKLNIVGFFASCVPIHATEDFAFMQFDRQSNNFLNRKLNFSSYFLVEFLSWQKKRNSTNKFRTEIGLEKISFRGRRFLTNRDYDSSRIQTFYFFSPSVISPPKDWPPNKYVVGNWLLPKLDFEPDSNLINFITAEEKPIFIGFGSMAFKEPAKLAQILTDAIQTTKVRAIISSGWADLAKFLPKQENLFIIDSYLPFEWLFPQVRLAIHHGGFGTVTTALRAGIPQIIVPVFADQPIWGKKLYHLGVSPQPIPIEELDSDRLVTAISTVLKSSTIGDRALDLQQKIEAEGDGVQRAVAIIDRYLS